MMSDSAADDGATSVASRAQEAAAPAQDEAEEHASSAGFSDTDQRNPDLDSRRPKEASAVAQDEGKDLVATGGKFETGNREPDVDVLAKGIASVLGPVMNSFDGGVEGVLKSQSILASSIDRLTRELDKLLEDVPHPYATHHATRLSGIRNRVIALNTSLRIIQKRMEMIQRLLAGYASRTGAGVKQGKVAVKGSHLTSHDVPLMEVLPYEVSGRSTDTESKDDLSRAEDSEMSIFSGTVPSEGLHDDDAEKRRDLKHVSPHKEPFIDQEPGARSIARDEEAGDLDVKAD